MYGEPAQGETRFVASLPADAVIIDSISDLQQQIIGEIQMEQLTAQQAKMVLEYFAQQAAEDAPEHNADTHMWMTRYQASLAIERQITEEDWDALVVAMADYQSFDRDPYGYLHDRGLPSTTPEWDAQNYYLLDQVSWAIDTAYTCSGA